MNIETSIKVAILDVIKSSLEALPEIERIITFKDAVGTTLSQVPFKELILSNSGDFYLFSSGGINSTTLRGDIVSTGAVATFEIEGEDTSSVKTVILSGTVGSLTSQADLKVNRVNWVSGRVVVWNNLSIKVR